MRSKGEDVPDRTNSKSTKVGRTSVEMPSLIRSSGLVGAGSHENHAEILGCYVVGNKDPCRQPHMREWSVVGRA